MATNEHIDSYYSHSNHIFLTNSKMNTIMLIKQINDQNYSHFRVEMVKQRTYSKYAQEAALLLGQQIKLGRKNRQWTEENLAERAGISRATLQKIESGLMSPSIGLVFEVASLVGVPLFEQDNRHLERSNELIQSKIALLPKRIRKPKKVADDDF